MQTHLPDGQASMKPRIIMTSSLVSCDGSLVTSNFSCLLSKKVDTGLQVVVPPGHLCYFLPLKGKKLKKVVLPESESPQPLILKPYDVYRVKYEEPLGILQFVTVNPFVKLEWKL